MCYYACSSFLSARHSQANQNCCLCNYMWQSLWASSSWTYAGNKTPNEHQRHILLDQWTSTEQANGPMSILCICTGGHARELRVYHSHTYTYIYPLFACRYSHSPSLPMIHSRRDRPQCVCVSDSHSQVTYYLSPSISNTARDWSKKSLIHTALAHCS